MFFTATLFLAGRNRLRFSYLVFVAHGDSIPFSLYLSSRRVSVLSQEQVSRHPASRRHPVLLQAKIQQHSRILETRRRHRRGMVTLSVARRHGPLLARPSGSPAFSVLAFC